MQEDADTRVDEAIQDALGECIAKLPASKAVANEYFDRLGTIQITNQISPMEGWPSGLRHRS